MSVVVQVLIYNRSRIQYLDIIKYLNIVESIKKAKLRSGKSHCIKTLSYSFSKMGNRHSHQKNPKLFCPEALNCSLKFRFKT